LSKSKYSHTKPHCDLYNVGNVFVLHALINHLLTENKNYSPVTLILLKRLTT